MTAPLSRSRRQFLGSLGVVVTAGLAGCTDNTATDDSTGDESVDTAESTSTGGTASNNLDHREANVVDVSLTEQSDTYEFAVTLHHDDDGEEGYANWWQIEQPDGTELGRRELLHAHSQQPFTRSETIAVPDDLGCVVVRGHDQTHGYGGQTMIVTPDSGATRAVDQGEKPEHFESAECP